MQLPGTSEKYVAYTWKGRYVVRKWPVKRGFPKDPIQASRVNRFADANRLAKFVNGNFWVKAHALAQGSGLYPRDFLVQAMLTGHADVVKDDGSLITYKEFFLEEAMFQGCTVQRTSGQVIASGGNRVITWQTPIIQTVPIWSAGAPTRLTVPTNVNIVTMKASVTSLAAVNGAQIVFIQNQAGVLVAATTVTQNAGVNGQCDSGPIYVAPGDWFECYVFWGANGTLAATARTTFSMIIENTTP